MNSPTSIRPPTQRSWRERAGRPTDPCHPQCPAPVHHDYSAHRQGCVSPRARADRLRYIKQRKAGVHPRVTTSNVGVTRRLQALAAIGWSTHDLAFRVGITPSAVARLTRGVDPRSRTATQRWVAELYEHLHDTPGPNDIVRQRSLTKGWIPPHEWLPGEIDDPAADPRPADDGDSYDGDLPSLVSAAKYRGLSWDRLSATDQDLLVVALRAEHHTLAAIADMVGTDHGAIKRVSDRLGRRAARASQPDQEREAS